MHFGIISRATSRPKKTAISNRGEKFETVYNSELGNDLGNLAQRVAAMLKRYQSGVIGDAPQAEHDMGPYREAMQHFEFNRALDEVWKLVRALNQYLEQVKPWEIAKHRETDTEAEPHLAEVSLMPRAHSSR